MKQTAGTHRKADPSSILRMAHRMDESIYPTSQLSMIVSLSDNICWYTTYMLTNNRSTEMIGGTTLKQAKEELTNLVEEYVEWI